MDVPEFKAVAGVFPVTPSGSNANFWHHQHEDEISLSPAEAARILTTIAPFMTAGGSGLSRSINGDPPLYALPTGHNLFETILFNIPHKKQEKEDHEVIAWRNKRPPGEARYQATTLEALTWRPRQIQLIPEEDNKGNIIIQKMRFKAGDSTEKFKWFDANLAYQFKNNSVDPLRMRKNHPTWRDAGPLVLLHKGKHGKNQGKKYFQRPDVVEYAFEIANTQKEIKINLYGMHAKNANILEWIKSSLIIPSPLGISSRLGSLVHQELEKAEEGAKSLHKNIKALYPPKGRKSNKDALKNIAIRCEQNYWKKLEALFHPLMNAFARLDPDAPDDPTLITATTSEWRKNIRKFALEQFDLAAKDMDNDSDALERRVHAQKELQKALKGILGEVTP